MRKLFKAFGVIIAFITVLTVPGPAAAWNTGMIKSDTDPGNIIPGQVLVGGQATTTVNAGQTMTVRTVYTETCFNANTSSQSCRQAGATNQTNIRRAYTMLHWPMGAGARDDEWVYLYLDRVGQEPSTFTAWAYSPYANTTRGADTANSRSQRITNDSAIALTGDANIGFQAPSSGNSRVMITNTRAAFTVTGVRAYVANRQMVVEWQLRRDQAPTGTVNVYQSVETTTRYDSWDLAGTFSLR
ncbi:MAG: hypothetical protein HY329_08860 [Chloroflexi bacterium]|nr:hypothetical protein [Chloroflexota bacterium]